MWYEDLRPFGATETELFGFVELVCSGKTFSVPGEKWVADGQPFATLFNAVYRCGFDTQGFSPADVERAATVARNSPLTCLASGFVLALAGSGLAAEQYLGRVQHLMTTEAHSDVALVTGWLRENSTTSLSMEDPGVVELREALLLKLGRSAGLVAPWFLIDEISPRADLQFLFRLAKFRGDLKGAVAIGKRLTEFSDEDSIVAQELQYLEREVAFVRARQLRERVEREKNEAREKATALQNQIQREKFEKIARIQTAAREKAVRLQQEIDRVQSEGAARTMTLAQEKAAAARDREGGYGEDDVTADESFEDVLRDLQPFLDGEAPDGDIHRTYAVLRAEISASTRDWALLTDIANEAQKTWPEDTIWAEYARSAEIQRLFDAYQKFERAGDDANAWNTLELLIGLDPSNPDFQGRAENFRHVIPGGREKEIRALFAPYEAGKPLGGGHFVNIEVGETWIKAHVRESDGTRAYLVLEHLSQATERSMLIPSFAMGFRGKARTGGISQELRMLASAAKNNAPEEFPWVAASFSDL